MTMPYVPDWMEDYVRKLRWPPGGRSVHDVVCSAYVLYLQCRVMAESSCGTCAFSQDEDAQSPDQTYCTAPGFYNGKAMEKSARCSRWSAK